MAKKMKMIKGLQKTGLSLIFVAVILLVLLPAIIQTAPIAAAGGTTSVTVTKYASDGTTIIAETTVTWEWMEANLDIKGDGSTHYYFQGPTFDDTSFATLWDPTETVNVDSRDYGAAKGTSVKDLCDLVGGASAGDTIKIKASDNFAKWFDYEDVYTPEARQGEMVITWYTTGSTEGDNGYVGGSGYPNGMRLIFFADTSTNGEKHVFGLMDMHDCLAEARWHYYYDGKFWPSSSGLSVKNVRYIQIFTDEPPPTSSPSPTPTPTPTPTPSPTPTPTPTSAPTPTSTSTSTPTPTSASESTPTPTATPTPTPTSTATSTSTPAPTTSENVELKIDMWDNGEMSGDWVVNSLGVLQNSISISSLDGVMAISIANGTKVLDSTLFPLTQISVAPVEPPSNVPTGYNIIRSFNFDPDGAQFAPGITVTVSFDASDAADGEALVLGFYNEADDEWEFIEGTDNGDGTATFIITHFSVYALMYQGDSSGAVAPVQEDKGISSNQLITIVAVAILVTVMASLIILQIRRRRPARQPARKSRKTANTNRSDQWD
ncbi:MAG: hypothetical protein WC455_06980 [Dehalococcoidia bacterium]|jgi:hypothetical protein